MAFMIYLLRMKSILFKRQEFLAIVVLFGLNSLKQAIILLSEKLIILFETDVVLVVASYICIIFERNIYK